MKKTEKLLASLRKNWPTGRYAFISEFRGGTGWAREARADAIAMDLWPSEGLELVGFELKTSRQDWLREVKNPDKSEPIKQFCDRWYLVVDDPSIVRRYEELPNDWGFILPEYSYNYDGRLKTEKEAPKLNPKPIDRLFLASLMRLAARDFEEVLIDGRKYIFAPSLPSSGGRGGEAPRTESIPPKPEVKTNTLF
jgi:hypothetical protein